MIEDVIADGPAERLAAALDLGLLETADRDAFRDPEQTGTALLIRMTVVLSHLAMIHSEREAELAALSLHESQLDGWICALADEVQREVDTLIRGNRFDGALRLGEIKSHFLTGVRIVARRRLGRTVAADAERELAHEATDLLRDYLEKERLNRKPPIFNDLLGGGWRRTVALTGVGSLVAFLAVAEVMPSRDPRRVDELDTRQARGFDPMLASGYRDHAATGSMFIGTLASSWAELDPAARRAHAELIRERALGEGAVEILMFDGDRVLQAHWSEGHWRTISWSQ